MNDSPPDPRNVFVIHGRNTNARRAMFSFLRAINLNPLEWSQCVKATIESTGKTSPYVGDILKQGFGMATAAIVLATPDDEARLKREFWQDSDGDSEKELSGQPRQNVLFEAGMAHGRYEAQTVIVELGHLREMSDTVGLHVVRMNNSVATRKELAQRLGAAGCAINLDGDDWCNEGDFEAAVAVEGAPEIQAVESDEPTAFPTKDARDDESTLHRPTAADFVSLGEHLWYLSNPPQAPFHHFIKATRGFFEKLDACGMNNTRTAAIPLSYLTIRYNARTKLITPASWHELTTMMVPIRSALESEARSKGLP